MERLLLTLGIIVASLAAGYVFRRRVDSGWAWCNTDDLARLRKRMQVLAIFFFMPVSAMFSLWGLPTPDARLLALPLLGVTAYVLGGALSIPVSRVLGLNRQQTGSFFCCATFTNIGAVGSLVCVLFLGEATIAMAALYRLCEEMFYYGIAFPVAQWYGQGHEGQRFTLRGLKADPLLCVVLLALGLGIALNVSALPRPEIARIGATVFMLLSTTFLLVTIGLGLRFSRMGGYVCPGLAVSIIKFVCVPLLIVTLAWLLGFGEVDSGLPLRAVAILSCMPVAMNALVPPSLYNLDLDLANACWIYSTLGLVVVLPVLLVVLPLL